MTDGDVKPALKRGHFAEKVDLPTVTETPERSGFPRGNGVDCSMPSKQYLAAAHPTGGHVTRLGPRASPPWTCSPRRGC